MLDTPPTRAARRKRSAQPIRNDSTCTTESHEALKLDNAAWNALPLIGVQVLVDGLEPATRIVCRNCTACGSTLGREVGLLRRKRNPIAPQMQSTRYSSARFGLCECCGLHASEVWSGSNDDGDTFVWGHHACVAAAIGMVAS